MYKDFLEEVKSAIDKIDLEQLQKMSDILVQVRPHGRLFICGSGGGAGHASHATADFRKLCAIETYCTSDNITELTAQTNDNGWEDTVVNYLKGSKFNCNDCLMVISVGGGSETVSVNLTNAILYACAIGAKVIGIVGRHHCTLTEFGHAWVVLNSRQLTPVCEGLQSVVLHLLTTKLAINKTIW